MKKIAATIAILIIGCFAIWAPIQAVSQEPNCGAGICTDCVGTSRDCCTQCQKSNQLLGCGCNQGCPCEICDLFTLINTAVKVVMMGLIPLAATLIIAWAGFKMMTNQGNSEVAKQVKTILLATGIGLIVIFAAYAIVGLVLVSMGAPVKGPLDWTPTCKTTN